MKQPTFDDLMDLELSLGFKIHKFVITKDKMVHATFIDVKSDNKRNKNIGSLVTTKPFDYRKTDTVTTITKELKNHRHPHNKHKPRADNNGKD